VVKSSCLYSDVVVKQESGAYVNDNVTSSFH
jgi:hypothetical protein